MFGEDIRIAVLPVIQWKIKSRILGQKNEDFICLRNRHSLFFSVNDLFP